VSDNVEKHFEPDMYIQIHLETELSMISTWMRVTPREDWHMSVPTVN